MRSALTMLLAVVLLSGCSRGKAAKSNPNEIYTTLNGLLQSGQTNEAIAAAARAIDDSVYARQRAELYFKYLQLLAASGRGEEAIQVYIRRISDAELAQAGYDVLLRYQARIGSTNAVEAWARRMVGEALPPAVQARNVSVLADVLLRQGVFERLTELVPLCLTRLEPAAGRRILDQVVQATIRASRFDVAMKLVDAVVAQQGERPEFAGFAALARLELLIGQNQWPQAEAEFLRVADSMADADLAKAMSMAGTEGRARKQAELVDRLSRAVLDSKRDLPAAHREAASQWVANGKQQGGAAETVRRLVALLDERMDPPVVLSFYSRDFYTILDGDDKAVARDMIVLGDRLAAQLTQAQDGETVTNLLFDACFMAGDYTRALAIMRGGMPGRDKEWLAMGENKLLAHLALQEGRTDEAVERFRKFMEYVASSWREGARDPMTGLLYTRDMALGLNARRVGDIMAAAKKEKESADAFREARSYFTNALSAAAADGPESAWLKQQLAALPGDPAQP